MTERKRLDEIASKESNLAGFNGVLVRYRHDRMRPHISQLTPKASVYDIGAGEGANASFLARFFSSVTAVEPAEAYRAILSRTITDNGIGDHVTVLPSLIEEIPEATHGTVDCIVATCVLEHVPDPVAFAAKAHALLRPGGLLLATVPNASSLHRRLGMMRGIIKEETELGPHDHAFGHLKYYTARTLRLDLAAGGFVGGIAVEGVMLKPAPNEQMVRLPSEILDMLHQEGRLLPEYCAELLAITTK